MNKVLYISAGILLLVFAFAVFEIALTAFMASLANSAANLVSSTALLTGQCLTAFLVVVSLAAGVVFGLGIGVLRSKSLSTPSAQPRWMPGQRPLAKNKCTHTGTGVLSKAIGVGGSAVGPSRCCNWWGIC
jgi:hypothetical protein